MKNVHAAIIGGGVIGSSIAWELSKYKLNVIVFEKGSDVASETSKANSGVIHSGINSPNGSLKARFCIEGNNMFQSISDKLGFPVEWVGKYIIAKNKEEAKKLRTIQKIGMRNKVPGLEIVDGKDVKIRESEVVCYQALWVPTAGITLPYEMTIAFAENAAINKVTFLLETKVFDIKKEEEMFQIHTSKGSYQTNVLINAAGVHCREIVAMVEEPDFNVYPCRGEYLVLDKNYRNLVHSMIYPIPPEKLDVLGIHITPTIEGNILLGPSAEYIDDLEDDKTTKNMMDTLLNDAKEIIPNIPKKGIINAYSGLRCKLVSPEERGWSDYRIEESKQISGLINLLGIESPGLTAAPAIAKEVCKMISQHFEMKKKEKFKIKKFRNKRFSEMTHEQQSKMIKKDSRWGHIICRCEHITEAEVIKALSNPLGAKTLSSVKYRCRAGMGRCQGGFCTQHIIRIIKQQFNIDINDLKLKSGKSNLFYGRTREENND
jgi:glycerol-3-phosphate dehydrogenase